MCWAHNKLGCTRFAQRCSVS